MCEPEIKCVNNASFKQIYTKNCLLLFQLREKSRFSRTPPKKFYNINYWSAADR